MPYTLAHPALVAPLRRWLVLGALAAGAMTPDLGYYLPEAWDWLVLWPGTEVTHTVPGSFGYDALSGLVVYLIWRMPVRPALLGALPQPWSAAALGATRDVLPGRPWPVRALLLYLSAAIGALSHVLLDVLTHDRPLTPGVLVDDDILGVPIATQLQRGLSVVGLALIVWWAVRWLGRVAPLRGFRPTHELLGMSAVIVASALVGLVVRLATTPLESRGDVVVQSLVGLTSGGVAALLAASAAVLLLRRRASGAHPDPAINPGG